MKIVARITAVLFIVLGILVILAGIYLALSGFLTPASQTPAAPGLLLNLSGWVSLAEVAVGATVGLQGLFLAAIGEVLWLLASISDHSDKSSQYLYAQLHRGSPLKA